MKGCSYGLMLALLLGACSGNATQLVVVVETDIDVPSGLDRVEVQVTGPSMTAETVTQAVAAGGDFPLTISVVPGQSGALGPVRIVAIGSVGGREVVRASATTSLRAGRSLMLVLFLGESCVDARCADGETCLAGRCGPDAVDSMSLPPWTGAPPPGRDAGAPDSAVNDAMSDADADAGTDASDADAGEGCRGPADCDDGLDCTTDSCGLDGCIHTADDTVCTAAAGGTCDTTLGCQYGSCTSETCTAGPCQTATCDGDTCLRTSTCRDGETCCADACVAAGCNDGVDCTVDSCGAGGCENVPMDALCDDGNECTDGACDAATGCDFMDNASVCDDGVFCNGEDTCAGGGCDGHGGDPCPGASVCDEGGSTCTGCAADSDCPDDSAGPYGACGSFGDTCDEAGTQSRSTTTFRCSAGDCVRSDGTEERSCSRNTEGDGCGASINGPWGTCSGFGGMCGESGTQSRTVTDLECGGGSCAMVARTETRSCSRSTDGDTCGAGSCMAWGTCDYTDTCDEAASQSRSCTNRECSGGSCGDVPAVETRPCTRSTDSDSCGATDCDAWGACDWASSCDEAASQTRECRDQICGAGTCGESPRIETQPCTRSTDGMVCRVGVRCMNDDLCSGGVCVDGGGGCPPGQTCCDFACFSVCP